MTNEVKYDKHFGHANLPFYESLFYWVSWLIFAIYPFYVGYTISQKYVDEIADDSFTVNWFSRKQDITDLEWSFWKSYSLPYFSVLALNVICSRCVSLKFPDAVKEFQVFLSVFIFGYIISLPGYFLVLLQVFVFYILMMKFNSRVLMWVYAIVMLYFVNTTSVRTIMLKIFFVDTTYEDITQISIMMCYLRLLSHGSHFLDEINSQKIQVNKKEDDVNSSCTDKKSIENISKDKDKVNNIGVNLTNIPHLISFLHYVFYLPFFFNGPVLTFDKFQPQWINKVKYSYKVIIKDIITTCIYAFMLELSLHFIYIRSITVYNHLLEELTAMESVSMAWMHLQIFLVKYIIFYRSVGIFAKLDGLIPPEPPKCISSLYTFIDMWRYFDKGLNSFIKQTIYIPMGGSRNGILRQIFGITSCFSFIAYWHGNDKALWFWGLTNCFGIICESCLAIMMKSSFGLRFRATISPVMYRRFCGVFGAVSIYFLIYTNAVFLTNIDQATILLKNLYKTWHANVLTLFILYCSVHCSIDIN